MDSEQKRIINSLILELRELMEEELELVLKHYGIFLKREWLDVEKLDFLSDEEKETKKKLEIYIKRKEKIGIKKEESTKEFITEATYHWLNRILGLKCLESRDLIEEVITTRSDYSGRSLFHRNYLEEHPELKKREDEGFFQCFYEILNKLTTEIKLIFDPKDIHMLIKPRITILKEIIKKVNTLEREIYQSDKFLGWIYQYFHDKEREIIYKRIKDEKLKVGGSNLIPLTQLYTEDYMVRFLAQNSLGSIWMEMYPKSQLFKKWEYYVESPNKEGRDIIDLSEIKILDPACGSGHFLVYLYEMLYEMYIEEGKVAVKDIPRIIIEKNLYGVDIDTRAIQIAALVLYIKYKEKVIDHTLEIPRFNLFSADIISYKTEVLNEFLNKFENNRFLKKIIVTIWSNLEDIREIGSLSQIDQIINRLIDDEIESNREGILGFTDSRIENWHSFRLEIIKRLKNFLQEAIQTFDINKELFAKEEEKGIWLLEAFENKYDIIITNPPYLGSNKLSDNLKKKLKKSYPLSYRDLYTMFIERTLSLLNNEGYTAIITMQSFMFITSFKHFRNYLLNRIQIKKLIHIGVNAFLEMGDHVAAVLLIFQKKLDSDIPNIPALFFNLRNIGEREEKIKNLINPEFKIIFNPENFKYIKESPFIYWVSNKIIDIFRTSSSMENIAPAREGCSTRNNEIYLRYWWEVKKANISNLDSDLNKRWYFYAKGGLYNKWHGNLERVVDWEKRGEGMVARNSDFYFLEGITFTKVSSVGFNARYLPLKCIFDSGGPSCFIITEEDIFFILGYLNSILARYFLSLLNPTVNTTVGDVNRLPFLNPNNNTRNNVSSYVKMIIGLKRKLSSFNITEWNYIITAIDYGLNSSKNIDFKSSYLMFVRYKELLLLEIILLESLIENEIFSLYDISSGEQEKIFNTQGFPIFSYPLIKKFDDMSAINIEIRERLPVYNIIDVEPQNLDKLGLEIKNIYSNNNSQFLDILTQISQRTMIHPISIFNIIVSLDLINHQNLKFEIENFISSLIIRIFKKDKLGFLILNEPSNREILIQRLLTEFDQIFDEKYTDNILKEFNNLFGKSIDNWIENNFFRNHISQFKKRPIIWHLSSEEKSFQCFIDYHKLSQNLLIILRNRYVEKRLTFLKEESKNITELLKYESNDSKIKELNKSYINIED